MNDYFSTQSQIYAQARPVYPEALFEFIAGLCAEKKLAWDCGTGNGQTAVALAEYFEKVIATDISRNQLANARQKPNITYKIEAAENSSLESNSADLITVATALHWMDIDKFFLEADRVLKSKGILAVWSYAGSSVNSEIDRVFHHFEKDILKDYWPPQIKLIWEDRYETITFPYELIPTPTFKIAGQYDLEKFRNYLLSWSGTQEYIKKHQQSPLELIEADLLNAWGNANETKTVTWELVLKCGRKP